MIFNSASPVLSDDILRSDRCGGRRQTPSMRRYVKMHITVTSPIDLNGGFMKIVRVIIFINIAWVLSVSGVGPALAEPPVNIGVIAKRGVEKAMQPSELSF